MLQRIAIIIFCLALGLAWAAPAWAAEGDQGVHLRWVELSLGGRPLQVRSGGVATLHPDTPFKVNDAKTSAWLDFGLSYRLKCLPQVDLGQYHTLTELLGRHVYNTDHLVLQVLKGDQVIGDVRLLVRLLPIDWLRRARESKGLNDKISFTKKALDLTPDDQLLAERLADLLIEARRYGEAADLLGQLALSREDPRWLARLADLYERLGQNQKAAATLSKLAALNPDDTALLDRLALLYEQEKRWEEAASVLARLSGLNYGQDKAKVLVRLARAQEEAGQASHALATLEQALALSARDAKLWQKLAEARQRAGDKPGALQALSQASRVSPDDLRLHLELAESFLGAGNKRRAAQELEKASALAPKEASHLLSLAKIYSELDDRRALVGVYARLIKLQPNDADLNYNLGVLLFEQDKYQKSLGYLMAAAKARPQDQEVRQLLFQVLLRLKKWDQAVGLAKKMLAAQPGDMKLLEMVFSGLSQDRPRDMAALLDRVVAKKPKQVKIYQMRAALALVDDDQAAAIKALKNAVKVKSDDLEILFQLAGLMEADGQPGEALKLYEKIMDQNPDYPGAEERYMALRTQQLKNKHNNEPAPRQNKP